MPGGGPEGLAFLCSGFSPLNNSRFTVGPGVTVTSSARLRSTEFAVQEREKEGVASLIYRIAILNDKPLNTFDLCCHNTHVAAAWSRVHSHVTKRSRRFHIRRLGILIRAGREQSHDCMHGLTSVRGLRVEVQHTCSGSGAVHLL